MTFWKLVFAGVKHHARMHVSVALGVAAATAIVVGALEIGASMRASLADLTVQRLGAVDSALVSTGWFREELATEVAVSPAVEQEYAGSLAVIWYPQTTLARQNEPDSFAGDVALWGVPPEFFGLWDEVAVTEPGSPPRSLANRALGPDEILLNDVAAERIGLSQEDFRNSDRETFVLVRVPDELGVPEEASLGRKDRRSITVARLKVVDILPSEGMGRFGLFPSQIPSPVAFVDRSFLQGEIDREGQANVLLVAGKNPRTYAPEAARDALQASLDPKLKDLGLSLAHERMTFPLSGGRESPEDDAGTGAAADTETRGADTPRSPGTEEAPGNEEAPETIYDYWTLTSDRLLIPTDVERVLDERMRHHRALPVMTYLANFIEVEREGQQNGGGENGAAENAEGKNADGEKTEAHGIPYSLVTGIELGEGFPLKDVDGRTIDPLRDDEIVLNSWAAEDLGVGPGAKVRLWYYLPESIDGTNEETSRVFTVVAVTPLTEPTTGWLRDRPPVYDSPPTLANDPNLTPEAPGLSDRESIEEWDPPFEMTRTTRGKDDTYWTNHRTTPKAFVSPAIARKLWGSRFGNVSSFRIPANTVEDPPALAQTIAQTVQADALQSRLVFRPAKMEGLYASSGSTPFDVLFLMLSMFILGSALALVLMLFRLGLEMRSTEVGLLAAVGWTRAKIGLAFLAEGAIVAAAGAAVGVLLGVGYAQLMILALTTWWVGAISTTSLQFHFDPVSLLAGFGGGLLASCATIAWATFRTRGSSVRALLRGGRDDGGRRGAFQESWAKRLGISWGRESFFQRWSIPLGVVAVLAGVGLALFAVRLGGMEQAGAFLGGGALLLMGGLAIVWGALRAGTRSATTIRFGWFRFLFENARRNPGRSVLTVSSVAIAAFLVIGVSAFRLAPTEQGTGGFDFLAEVDRPVFDNPLSEAGRLSLYKTHSADLARVEMLPLRYRLGDDASCNNLYQARRPQAWGVPSEVIERLGVRRNRTSGTGYAGFAFGAVEPGFEKNPWLVLEQDFGDAVPVIIDRNTAMYSLKLYGGIGETFEVDYGAGQVVKFRVSGLLADTILQGGLLLSEKNFIERFPESPGYRFFLVDTWSPNRIKREEATEALRAALGSDGLTLEDADARLAGFLAVQNTYLQTFQSLGALGLLLGAFGVAAAQMRNVFERRRELALLRAVGFSRGRVGSAVLTENLALLAVGFLLGGLAAAAAALPQVFLRGLDAPWGAILFLSIAIVGVGMITSWLATRFLFRLPLLTALRGE